MLLDPQDLVSDGMSGELPRQLFIEKNADRRGSL